MRPNVALAGLAQRAAEAPTGLMLLAASALAGDRAAQRFLIVPIGRS